MKKHSIKHFLSSLDECDRTKFCEAIADASHYVASALDVLPASDHFSFPELCRALNHLNDLNDEIQAHLCDADDDAGDKALQEAYDIIAADDANPLDFSGIEKAIADEKKSAKVDPWELYLDRLEKLGEIANDDPRDTELATELMRGWH